MKTKTDWEYLKNMKESDIDYSDIPETDEEFWEGAELSFPESIEVKIKVDREIAVWLKKMGTKSDVIVNKLLQSYFIGMTHLQNKKN